MNEGINGSTDEPKPDEISTVVPIPLEVVVTVPVTTEETLQENSASLLIGQHVLSETQVEDAVNGAVECGPSATTVTEVDVKSDPDLSAGMIATNNMILQDDSSVVTTAGGKQYLIVATNGGAALGMGSLQPVQEEDQEPALKKFKILGEDGQSYILTLTDPPTASVVSNVPGQATEHQYQTKEIENFVNDSASKGIEKRNQLLGSDVSQAWFTTRDDKNILQNSGASWKQGQWTKDEIDLLQMNIGEYCREHSISDPTEIIFEMSKDERKEFYRTVAKGLQRPLFSVYRRVTRMYDQKNHMGKYSPEEIMKLRELRSAHGNDWATIGQALGRSASSVKDKCRLMKDTCNSGKWLPEEEKRLTTAVYELAGCKPGEDVVHGLSWSAVSEKVVTRSEKQCRTKWLNYMNWKLKGGKEWTREDDMNLILRVSNLGVNDDTEIDWNDLCKNWESSVRSPQWLRGKWWSLKRHIPDYQLISFTELLENMKSFYLHNVRTRHSLLSPARTKKLEAGSENLTYVPLTLQGDGSLDELDPTVQAYEVLQQLPSSSASYIITQSTGNQLHTSLSDHIIVQTVPITQTTDSELGLQPRVVIRVPSSSDLTDAGVTALEASDLGTTIQLPGPIDQTQQGLEGLTEGSVIAADSLTDTTFHTHNLEESVISGPGDVGIVIKQEAFVQVAGTNGQLMSSFADPMLNSDTNGLMEVTSDMETDKNHVDEMTTIDNI